MGIENHLHKSGTAEQHLCSHRQESTTQSSCDIIMTRKCGCLWYRPPVTMSQLDCDVDSGRYEHKWCPAVPLLWRWFSKPIFLDRSARYVQNWIFTSHIYFTLTKSIKYDDTSMKYPDFSTVREKNNKNPLQNLP